MTHEERSECYIPGGMKRAFVCSRSKLCHQSHLPRFRSRSTGVDLRRVWPIRTFLCHVPVLRSARLRTPTAFPFVASYSPSQSYSDTITMAFRNSVPRPKPMRDVPPRLQKLAVDSTLDWLPVVRSSLFVAADFVHRVPR